MHRISKQDYYLTIARAVSLRSTCLKRRYGCVIVKDDEIIATGYNGAPRGTDNCCDIHTECPRKNVPHNSGNYAGCNAVHAEQNALLSASRSNAMGATLYLAGYEFKSEIDDWVPITRCEPCPICANMITNAGIKTVIGEFETPIRNMKMIQQEHICRYELSEKRREFINKILTMTGKEIYDKYGMKRDENITETIQFPHNYEMDIKCCMPDSDESTPWTEAVLLHNSQEITFTEPAMDFVREWSLRDDNQTFTVLVV